MKLNPVKATFATFEGLLTVFKHLFKRPVTQEYPEKKRKLPQRFRGKLAADCAKCIGCGTCVRVCPTGAINLCKNSEGVVTDFQIDLKKCIFCGNCTYYCPKGVLSMTKEYELATENKDDLLLNFKGGKNAQ